ncbi:MAG: sensor histidine kinase [Kiloniellales bacterium]
MASPAVVAVLFGVALLGLGLLLFHALRDSDAELRVHEEELVYAIHEMEREFGRLIIAGLNAESHGAVADLEDMTLRLEIFVSRVKVLRSLHFEHSFFHQPAYLALLQEVDRIVRRADTVVAQLPQLGTEEVAHRVLAILMPLSPSLREIALETTRVHKQRWIDHQAHTQQHLVTIVLLFAVFMVIVFSCVFLFWVQNRRLRHSHAVLSRLSKDLVQANQTKSRFLANMSHELRTPLNAVLGFSEIMRDQHLGPLSERYRSYAEDIHCSAQHLLELINDVLDLSKLEAERRELDLAYLSIHEELSYIARLMAGEARDRGVELVCGPKAVLPPVQADRLALRQILLNLVSNALKFSEAGGRVELLAVADGDSLRISIVDEGIGIDAADLDRVLEPFEQARASAQRAVGKGTGLGLPLSKGLVELHGGRLWIESSREVGTTVSFTLPLQAQPPEVLEERLSA